jgi:hypothetical protein
MRYGLIVGSEHETHAPQSTMTCRRAISAMGMYIYRAVAKKYQSETKPEYYVLIFAEWIMKRTLLALKTPHAHLTGLDERD